MYEHLPPSTKNPSADTFEGCPYGFVAGSLEGFAILDQKFGLLLSGSLLKAESLFRSFQEKRGINIFVTIVIVPVLSTRTIVYKLDLRGLR